MSGHSKWSTIKHKKGAADAKRGKVFTRILKEMTVAARMGGGDPNGNPRLRAAIAEAKANNMPKDNIDRAIKRGTGEIEGVTYEELTYEGYGPGGVALLIDAVTDNPTRTVAEVRSKMSRLGGNLGTPNSVAWMFEKKGQVYVDASKIDEDSLMEKALDAGAEDVQREDDRFLITTSPGDFHAVQESLKGKDVQVVEAELAMVPKNTVQIGGKEGDSLLKLLETLEDLDDVQKVWANFDMDVSEMARAEG